MQRWRSCRAVWFVPGAAVLALGLLAPPRAAAQPPLLPAGGEFQVNTYTTQRQRLPSVGAYAKGSFIVVWPSNGSPETDTSSDSIQGQRYATDGSPQGAQFQVNSYTTGYQSNPSVAASADGDFVVVWAGPEIQAQRYASDGSPQGAEFQVNTYTTGLQTNPSVAADPDGDFVVVWHGNGSFGTDTSLFHTSIQGQRYASDGSTQGAQFQVNTYTTERQRFPVVAAEANGDFVVVWNSLGGYGTDTHSYSIQGQRYASDGSTQGAQFQINTYTTGSQHSAQMAMDADGDFVAVWDYNGPMDGDIFPRASLGQRFASSGSALGAEFHVNAYTTGDQGEPSVAKHPDGGFVVVWESVGSWGTDPSNFSIQGQLYASDGSTQGAQFQVNSYTTDVQQFPRVAVAADGDIVVVWHSLGSSGTDTSMESIHAQRYRPPIVAPALSPVAIAVLGAALILLGVAFARAYRSVKGRSS